VLIEHKKKTSFSVEHNHFSTLLKHSYMIWLTIIGLQTQNLKVKYIY